MDIITQHFPTLRDSVLRNSYTETTAIDVLTAFYAILKKPTDYSSITDDKFFTFLLGCLRNVPRDADSRKFWMDTMFTTYEKMSGISPIDPNWLLLRANLVFLAPVCAA